MKKQYDQTQVGTGNGKVYIGIPRERLYIPAFVDNRDQILMELQKLGRGCGYYQADGHRVDRNRDHIVEAFMGHNEKPEWLLMLDSDMDHPRSIVERLIRWNKPIISGLYFHRGQYHDPFAFMEAPSEKDEYGRMTKLWRPMRDEVYQFLMENNVQMYDGAITIDQCVNSPLVECDAVATGTMLVHRSVFETMAAPWFEYRAGGNSEDMQFCWEAKHDYGIPVFCDFSTISGHYIFSPQGQAQFRLMYEKRGLMLSGFTKREAIEWVAEFLEIPYEASDEKISKGNAHMVSDYWIAKFRNKKPTDQEIANFYRDSYTGQLYIIELLHWNFTPVFASIKSLFMGIRGKKVLEIGSGIGTLAIQLSIQKNDVTAVEPNETLSDFIKFRIAKLKKLITTELGDIALINDDKWKAIEPETFDYVVSTDTFEHIPATELRSMLRDIARLLKVGGHLLYHANFKQQDLYPMHFDHSAEWDAWLTEAGLASISPQHAVKVR